MWNPFFKKKEEKPEEIIINEQKNTITQEDLNSKDTTVRELAYEKYGYPLSAINDSYVYLALKAYLYNKIPEKMKEDERYGIRAKYYEMFIEDRDCLNDPSVYVRQSGYARFGYTEQAFNDCDIDIRRKAYEALGYTKQAFNDINAEIRLKAYRKLGFEIEAIHDEDEYIRNEAMKYFKFLYYYEAGKYYKYINEHKMN